MNDSKEKSGWGERLRLALPAFGIRHPWLTILAVTVMTVAFAVQFPKVRFDNDPENMLAPDEPVRVLHREVKARYSLFDFVIVGIVNDTHPDGIFNVETLGRIHRLTGELLSLRQGQDGLPVVMREDAAEAARPVTVDLRSSNRWERALGAAFRQNPNRLFTETGDSAIIGRELIAPSVVDNLRQAELGSLKLEYLMERPPRTREEALSIKRDAMDNPLYNGALVSEDGKAVCLYIPLADKTYSYNAARLVKALTQGWDGADRVHITGQPVAQDTFGVEMLIQMATSAPLAGLVIFLLLLFFFRRLQLILAPMLIAIVSVVSAMGLLIGLGYDVHIMSSMIAIFLMPIAVSDSVHILSEFFDTYHHYGDKARAIRAIMSHLFRPMLYTSLTTIAGFASLATTPIPPVQVFGLHVAFGVAMAWLLTMVLVPAYIMVAVSRKTLEHMTARKDVTGGPSAGSLEHMLGLLGRFASVRSRATLGAVLLVGVLSAAGVMRIRVNDNPVKWFVESHPIRVADKELNAHFGGTYTAYLTLAPSGDTGGSVAAVAADLKARGTQVFGATPAAAAFAAAVDRAAESAATEDAFFAALAASAAGLDAAAPSAWGALADAINYLEPESLTLDTLRQALTGNKEVNAQAAKELLAALEGKGDLKGESFHEAALAQADARSVASFVNVVRERQADLSAPVFKRPAMLQWLQALQAHVTRNPVVGKTTTVADALVKANYELNFQEGAAAGVNERHRAVPATAAGVGQVFTQLEGMKRKDSLFHLVTRDYQETCLWVQLKSGDNVDMASVVKDVDAYLAVNPPPMPLEKGWAGLTYLNVVWQAKMVKGMFASLASSFVTVLIMMIVLYRSFLFGLLSMVPLSITILFIYGLIGWVGKDYDMPIAVLSSLTLGLSVDFAIHFLERAREEAKRLGSWKAALPRMFMEPATAISRNALTISLGFLPLLMAPLVPYQTVGFFLAAIMAVSWLATLFILPALLTVLEKWAFPDTVKPKGDQP